MSRPLSPSVSLSQPLPSLRHYSTTTTPLACIPPSLPRLHLSTHLCYSSSLWLLVLVSRPTACPPALLCCFLFPVLPRPRPPLCLPCLFPFIRLRDSFPVPCLLRLMSDLHDWLAEVEFSPFCAHRRGRGEAAEGEDDQRPPSSPTDKENVDANIAPQRSQARGRRSNGQKDGQSQPRKRKVETRLERKRRGRGLATQEEEERVEEEGEGAEDAARQAMLEGKYDEDEEERRSQDARQRRTEQQREEEETEGRGKRRREGGAAAPSPSRQVSSARPPGGRSLSRASRPTPSSSSSSPSSSLDSMRRYFAELDHTPTDRHRGSRPRG